MINADLEITPPAIGRPARLRAEAIARAILIQIGRTLAESDDRSRDLIEALEDLGQIADGILRDGSLDGALDDVATLANLDAPEMDLSTADVQQLAAQATSALAGPVGTVVRLPAQRGGEAA